MLYTSWTIFDNLLASAFFLVVILFFIWFSYNMVIEIISNSGDDEDEYDENRWRFDSKEET